jgi:uncharacterized peroxidase-related enzyme
MTEFPVHTPSTAPAGSRPILEALAAEVGFVPNLAATMAESPALLEAFTTARSIVRRGTFSGPERETIALTVSFENNCSYCMAAHCTFAEMEGAPAVALAALRAGEAPRSEPRLAALSTFVRQMVRQRGFASGEDLRAFFAGGFTRPQVLEVLAVVGMTSLANWTHNLAGTPVDAAFLHQQWEVPEPTTAPVG